MPGLCSKNIYKTELRAKTQKPFQQKKTDDNCATVQVYYDVNGDPWLYQDVRQGLQSKQNTENPSSFESQVTVSV